MTTRYFAPNNGGININGIAAVVYCPGIVIVLKNNMYNCFKLLFTSKTQRT